MNNIFITIKKELRSILRDRKTLAMMFVYPLLIPLMVILYGSIYESMDTEEETPKYHIGINYELNELEKTSLESASLEYTKYNTLEEMQTAYDKKEIEGYITYNKDTKEYKIYLNTSGASGLTTGELIYTYLDNYSNALSNEYLLNHNINLEEAFNHFTITEEELGENNYVVSILMSVSLTYVILSICIATSNMAINTTATEKENGTLETILTFPIKKNELIIGKYLSSVIIGLMASLVALIFLFVSLYIGKNVYTIYEDYEIILNLGTIIGSIITVIAASMFIAGISLLLTAFAKSYKEAQGKISLITMIAIIPMIISVLDINIDYKYYLIPVCNFVQVLTDLLLNNANIINVIITFTSSTIYTFLVITFIIKAYNSEKILFTN